MKKICFIMLGMIFVLSGCGKKSNILSEASNNFKELKSYEMKLSIDTDIKNGSKQNTSKYYISGIYDNENQISKIYNKTDVGSTKTTGFMILDKKNKNLYVSQDSKNWQSITSDDAALTGVSFDKINPNLDETIFDVLADGKQLIQYQDDENGNLNYDVTISLNRIAKILSLSDIISALNINTDDLVINVSIDKETKNYTNIDINFNSLLDDATDETIIVNNLSYVYSFDKFNSIETIDIPNVNVNDNNENNENNENVTPNNGGENNTNQNYDLSEYEDAAYGLRKAAQLYYQVKLLDSVDGKTKISVTCDGVQCLDIYHSDSLDIDGLIPTAGMISADSLDNMTFQYVAYGNVKCDIQGSSVKCHY